MRQFAASNKYCLVQSGIFLKFMIVIEHDEKRGFQMSVKLLKVAFGEYGNTLGEFRG